ncbi:cysteine-rich CWC family protein [Solibacillus silvestris]|uniref:cysteine-rich CWC family protein n=1 Tax=Solibacillus silvestris TaxID=76853 RepID=UPI003F821861
MNEQQCPICYGTNACNVEDAKNCWCMKVKIPKQLLDKMDGKSCICQKCIEKYSHVYTSPFR